MFLILALTAKSSSETVCVCVCLCIRVWCVCTYLHDLNLILFFLWAFFPRLFLATLRSTLTYQGTARETGLLAGWFHISSVCGTFLFFSPFSLFLSSRFVQEERWTPEQSSVRHLTPRSSWVASTTGNLSLRVRTELTHTVVKASTAQNLDAIIGLYERREGRGLKSISKMCV